MKRETALKSVLAVMLALFIALAAFAGFALGGQAMLLLFAAAFCAAFFILVELYLRIQHNILGVHQKLEEVRNRMARLQDRLEEKADTATGLLKKQENSFTRELQDIANAMDRMIDFDELLLRHLDAEGKQRSDTADYLRMIRDAQDRIADSITGFSSRLNGGKSPEGPEEVQKRTAELNDQIRFLREKLDALQAALPLEGRRS